MKECHAFLQPGDSLVVTVARLLGVSVGTLYNHIPDLKELRGSRIPAQLEGSMS
ncbi:hypothetical protein [Streptomyces violaceusniger]|uniref:hypothetical protein n=1 Tax=Streptomyces violaceusniger TaxID=68280 RepID=UPI00207312A8|nr:hypothetical protein [Streptomyces violaceusniger]